MEITYVHLVGLVIIVIGSGIYSAPNVKSAEGYSLGGRSSGAILISGSIAGTVVGGGATVGTAQLAYSLGLSAWWFTLGSGIGFILLGIFYARPLRKTGLETIPQYLVLNYGKMAGSLASVIASIGILFSAVASCLPGIQIIAAIFDLTPWSAAVLLIMLVIGYIFFSGMKGAGVSGMMKLIIIWITLFTAGGTACFSLYGMRNFWLMFPSDPWFSFLGKSPWETVGNLFSLIVGIICTQTYIQTIFSASDSRTAAVGSFAAALVVIPVGLPSIAIAMFMHATHPHILPILALPMYLLQYQPAWLGGIGIAGIMLSLIGSISGLALGIGTMVSKDICYELLDIRKTERVLLVNRSTVVIVTFIACLIAILNLKSNVLDWNYMSMALRGGGIFIPLTLAVFAPGILAPGWAVASMVLSTIAAIVAKTILHLEINPLFVGIGVSAVFIIIGMIFRRKEYVMNS